MVLDPAFVGVSSLSSQITEHRWFLGQFNYFVWHCNGTRHSFVKTYGTATQRMTLNVNCGLWLIYQYWFTNCSKHTTQMQGDIIEVLGLGWVYGTLSA